LAKLLPARPAIAESLEGQHPSQYACQCYVHETGWLMQSGWVAQPVSTFSPATRSALAKVPPERLPRRAVRGLGAHSHHQTGPFLPTHSFDEPQFYSPRGPADAKEDRTVRHALAVPERAVNETLAVGTPTSAKFRHPRSVGLSI
jgi:hypothetical protein